MQTPDGESRYISLLLSSPDLILRFFITSKMFLKTIPFHILKAFYILVISHHLMTFIFLELNLIFQLLSSVRCHICSVRGEMTMAMTTSQLNVVPAQLEVDSSIYIVSVVCLQERARCFMTTSFMSCSYKIINLLKQTCHNVCIQVGIVLQSHDLGKISYTWA